MTALLDKNGFDETFACSGDALLSVASCRQMLFSVIKKFNSDGTYGLEPQDLVLEGLALIYADPSPDCFRALQGALDDVLVFVVGSFKHLINNAPKGELLMKVISVLTMLSGLSECCVEYVLEKVIDKAIGIATVQQVSIDNECDPEATLIIMQEIVSTSQVACQLRCFLCNELSSMGSDMQDVVSNEKRYLRRISFLKNRINKLNKVLLKSRNELKALVNSFFNSSKHADLFKASSFTSSMINSCNLEDFYHCSHILKIFLIVGESSHLCDVITQYFSDDFMSLFLATMRAEDYHLEDVLGKYWLLQNVCRNLNYRVLVFLAEGGVLEMLTVLRSASMMNVNIGDSVAMLSSFCTSPNFLKKSLTNAQLIQNFGGLLQCGGSHFVRQNAFVILKTFADGLNISDSLSAKISASFIESGILYSLVNTIANDDEIDEELPSRQEMGTTLLCMLIANKAICKAFLGAPLSILQCLDSSRDVIESKCQVTSSLVRILDVLIDDEGSHSRLFESHVLHDLKTFIKDLLLWEENRMTVDNYSKVDLIRSCLSVFDKMASFDCCSKYFNEMNLTNFLRLLLRHNDASVVCLSSSILNKIDKIPSTEKWKMIFAGFEDFHSLEK